MSLALVVLGISLLLGCPPSNNSTAPGGEDPTDTITGDGDGDTTDPTLSSSVPVAGATDFPANSNIMLTYSETVQAGSGGITITPTVAGTPQVSIAGNVVTINPANNLVAGTRYTLTISAGAFMDAAGNETAEDTLSFTAAALDTTAPTISSTLPANNASPVALASNIVLTYNEPVQAGTGNITITPMGGPAITDAQVTIVGAVVTIDPTADFAPDTVHTVSIPAGAIEDLVGNASAEDFMLSFTTAPPTRTVVLWVAYSVRSGGAIPASCTGVNSKPSVAPDGEGTVTRRFLATGDGANQNPANFTVDNTPSGGLLLSGYMGATPVYAANNMTTTDLTDNDLVANSYADFISPTTNLLLTLGQAGLNGKANRTSLTGGPRFWTGITNMAGSPASYVAGPACQESTSGPFWGAGSIHDDGNVDGGTFGVSNSITKVSRVGSAVRSDVFSTKSTTCRDAINVLCISY